MRKLILFLLLSIVSYFGIGQNIGINSLGTAPAASAMLDIAASDKGLLIPRVDIVDLSTAVPVVAPITSLLVYNTNVSSGVGYYFWDGTKWTKLSDANSNSDHDWYEVGGTSSPDNINDNIFTQGKVGIGTISPTMKLEVDNGGVKIKTTSGHIVLEDSDQTLGEMTRIERDGGGLVVDLVSTNTALFKILDNGNVGVNTITPSEKLEIQGSIKIVDGTEGVDKVLVSDATGKASWKASAVSTSIFSTSNSFPFSATTPTSGTYYDVHTFTITIPGIYKFHYDFTAPVGYILCIDNVSVWSMLRTAGGRNFGHQAVFLTAGTHIVKVYNDGGTAGTLGPYFNFSAKGPIN